MQNQKNSFAKNYFEHQAWANNLYVCGIDEAGRGCLGGPLVVGAVVLPINSKNPDLRDSKVMTEAERERAYAWITQHCFYTYVIVDVDTIERLNIYQATRAAMKKAFLQMIEMIPFAHTQIKHLVIDAVPLTLEFPYQHKQLEIHHPTHCESLSSSVAAASIVAKVTRDHLMNDFAKLFPQFALEQHKGYGTKDHTRAIESCGTSLIHRPSFLSNIITVKSHEQQQSIC